MTPSQRIVLNTIATYTRSVISGGLALFSSRWVLGALGQTDFGLFNLVGSIIVFVTFLNMVLSASVARHYAYSIGKGGLDEVNRWFNAAFGMHLLMAVVLTLIGWPIGEYVIDHILIIPDDRILVSLQVFRISLVSAFLSMLSVPFVAMFTAKQHIATLSLWGTFQSLMSFMLAILLFWVSGDKLLFYAIGMVVIFALIYITQIFYATLVFPECRINFHMWYSKSHVIEIVSFAGWSLVGNLGLIFRNQGSAILLNIYFGPVANAAYGIANQISSQTKQLAAAMVGAFSPEITTSEGRGDRERMLFLSRHASKLGTILVLIFAIPLMIEMDFILKIWLTEVPLHTASICQFIIIAFIIERLNAGDQLAVHATGKIALYESVVGFCLFMTLPLAWCLIKLGSSPAGIGLAFLISQLVFSVARAFLSRHLLGSSINQWFQGVVIPCVRVGLVGFFVALLFRWSMPPSWTRFIYGSLLSIVASSVVTFFWGLEERERQFVKGVFRKMAGKIRTSKKFI